MIFDFDGTLADSYAAIAASVNHVRSRHGLAPLPVDEVKRHVGRGAEYLLEHTAPAGSLPENLAIYREHHPTVMRSMTRLLPGAAELIPALHRRGQKIGLCSNKPRVFSLGILEHFKLIPYFGAVLGPGDVPAPKPAPDMLQAAMEVLGVTTDQALYVGDMTVDIQTARGAGVCVWAVPTGSESREVVERAKPDRMLVDLMELVAELEGV